jgi:hypothetical protein
MRQATALLYHVCAVASRNIRFASCGTSGKLTLWTRYVSWNHLYSNFNLEQCFLLTGRYVLSVTRILERAAILCLGTWLKLTSTVFWEHYLMRSSVICTCCLEDVMWNDRDRYLRWGKFAKMFSISHYAKMVLEKCKRTYEYNTKPGHRQTGL